MVSPAPSGGGDLSSVLQTVVTAMQNVTQNISSLSSGLRKTFANIKPSILIGNPTGSDGSLQPITLDSTLQFYGTALGVNLSELESILSPLFLKPGKIDTWAMATPPAGWLVCDGSAISRTTYAALFLAIGTTWGSGDGSTTFNIPPFQDAFLRGWNSSGSRAFASFQADAFASHTHAVTDPGHDHGVTDPGHGHALTDPGHHHGVNNFSALNGGTDTLLNEGAGINSPSNTTSSTTGITLNSNTTGITNQSNTTGITNQSTGGNETRPQNYAVLICIKT